MTDFTPRPTVYNGVQMRSRLEAGFAMWLDEWGFRWEYEPCAFGTGAGQYLPDFRLDDITVGWLGTKEPIYIEVKHAEWFSKAVKVDRVALMEANAHIIRENEPRSVLLTAQPKADPFFVWNPCGQHGCVTERAHFFMVAGVGRVMSCEATRKPWPDGYWKVGDDQAEPY